MHAGFLAASRRAGRAAKKVRTRAAQVADGVGECVGRLLCGPRHRLNVLLCGSIVAIVFDQEQEW